MAGDSTCMKFTLEKERLLVKDVLEDLLNVLLHPWGNGEVIIGCLMISDAQCANISLLAQSECIEKGKGGYQVQKREWVSDKMTFRELFVCLFSTSCVRWWILQLSLEMGVIMVLKKYEMSRGETGAVNNTMVSGFRSQVESGLFNEFREYEYICKLMGK